MNTQDIIAFVVVGALLAIMGKGVSSIVFQGSPKAGCSGWRGVYYVTLWLHPILLGGLLGYLGQLPAPTGLGSTDWGRVIWYCLSGGFSSTLYSAVKGFIKQRVAREEIRESERPSARGDQ